jgi:MFS family permease
VRKYLVITESKKNENYRWVILTVVYLSILAFTLIFQSIPPILPFILSELHLTYSQSGLLMSLFALPGIFVSLLGGFLADRYGMRPLGTGCFLLMIGGTLLVGLGMNLQILWLGRIIAGIGGFTLSVFLPKLLSQWFKDRELGLAMGIYNTGVPLGSVICFGLFGRMGSLWGWRIPILLTGIYLLITFILFLILYRLPPSREMGENKPLTILKSSKKMGWPIWWAFPGSGSMPPSPPLPHLHLIFFCRRATRLNKVASSSGYPF